jgi:hypothetical protein
MYNFVLHNHLHINLLFQLIVENDEDLDDQYFDQNALKKKENFIFFVKLIINKLLQQPFEDHSIDYH